MPEVNINIIVRNVTMETFPNVRNELLQFIQAHPEFVVRDLSFSEKRVEARPEEEMSNVLRQMLDEIKKLREEQPTG